MDLKTAFLQGEHYNTESRSVIIQLPNDIGLPPWMVGVCLRPVYGLNDAPRRWWNRLDKFLVSIGLEPTRADRCTYVGYQGIESQKPKPYKAKSVQEEGSPFGEESSMYCDSASSYLKEVALSALNCYAYDEGSQSTSDTAEERSYMSCHLILLPVSILLTLRRWSTMPGDLLLTLNCWASLVVWLTRKEVGSPYENGQALVSHRAKALRGPEPTFKVKDYPYRVSFVLRQGTWWVVERAQDLRIENKPCYLEEEAEVLVTMFLPEKASYKVDSLSQLTPELVDQLLEHFVDPVNGSPSKGRRSVGVLSLHVDDLIISGTPQFLKWFLEKIKKHFTVGHEGVNDLMFTGQRVQMGF